MPTVVPLTKEDAWLASLPSMPLWEPPPVATLVIAPHPDDETLGAGGLITRLRGQGVPVTAVAVTDGEHAYSDGPEEVAALAMIRSAEQTEALARLGVAPDSIKRLHLPDRDVTLCEEELVTALRAIAAPGMHLVAPWERDFHPDHEASGRAAARVARELGLELTYYLFWTWHRGVPAMLSNVPLQMLALTKREQDAKDYALRAHASQLEHQDGQPILSDELLAPARRSFEVYIRQ